MLAVVRSELVRLVRPRLMLAWGGLTLLFALMVNTVMFSAASSGIALPPGAPGVGFPPLAELVEPGGLMAGLGAASSMFGIVTLAFWALAVASDYSSGLIRLLVAAEPRRWRLVLGKALALVLLTALVTAVACVINAMAALPAAQAAGIDTAAWGSDLPAVVGGAWANAFAAQLVWGCIGLVLAVIARSAAVAISIGVGYVLVVESVIKMAEGVPTDWLPGTTITAIASGGTHAVAYGTAITLGAGYGIVALALAVLVTTRRDVTD